MGNLCAINSALANPDGRSTLKHLLASLFPGPILTVVLAATHETAGHQMKWVDLWRGRGGPRALG